MVCLYFIGIAVSGDKTPYMCPEFKITNDSIAKIYVVFA